MDEVARTDKAQRHLGGVFDDLGNRLPPSSDILLRVNWKWCDEGQTWRKEGKGRELRRSSLPP